MMKVHNKNLSQKIKIKMNCRLLMKVRELSLGRIRIVNLKLIKI